jgi:4'-phosphopantetheinyl transferase
VARSVPEGAEVELWCIALDAGRAGPAGAAVLSGDERERAARFHFSTDRERWIRGRLGLRGVLAGYLGIGPADLRFTYGPQGKPGLDLPYADLCFNLAHCDDLAVIAVRRGAAVGVDLERVRPVADAPDIASRFFSPLERDAVLGPGTDGLPRRFFACWTRKEAVIKATGLGLSFGLDRFAVSVPPDDPPRVLAVADDPTGAPSWSLVHFEPVPGFIGAVACQAPVSRAPVRWWNA